MHAPTVMSPSCKRVLFAPAVPRDFRSDSLAMCAKRSTVWVFDKPRLDMIGLLCTPMEASVVYNKKDKKEKAKKAAPKRRAAVQLADSLAAPPVDKSDLTAVDEAGEAITRKKYWLEDVVSLVDQAHTRVLQQMQVEAQEDAILAVKHLVYSICLEFCFVGSVCLNDRVYETWSSLREKLHAFILECYTKGIQNQQQAGNGAFAQTILAQLQLGGAATTATTTTTGTTGPQHNKLATLQDDVGAQLKDFLAGNNPTRLARLQPAYIRVLGNVLTPLESQAADAVASTCTKAGLMQALWEEVCKEIKPAWIASARVIADVLRSSPTAVPDAFVCLGSLPTAINFLQVRTKYVVQALEDVCAAISGCSSLLLNVSTFIENVKQVMPHVFPLDSHIDDASKWLETWLSVWDVCNSCSKMTADQLRHLLAAKGFGAQEEGASAASAAPALVANAAVAPARESVHVPLTDFYNFVSSAEVEAPAELMSWFRSREKVLLPANVASTQYLMHIGTVIQAAMYNHAFTHQFEESVRLISVDATANPLTFHMEHGAVIELPLVGPVSIIGSNTSVLVSAVVVSNGGASPPGVPVGFYVRGDRLPTLQVRMWFLPGSCQR